MEYNKDEACRAMEIAEKKLAVQEVVTAKKLLVKAQQLYPSLEGLPQMMAVLDVYIAAEKKVNGQTDWYGILQVDTVADEALIKKQYRKLALMLHPDKNKCAGAEGAFKLIGEAWTVLSDKIKRSVYDHKRIYVPPPANRIQKNPRPNAAPAPTRPQTVHNGGFFKSGTGAPPTFWTACPHCRMQYEYLRNFINHNLQCPNCSKPFMALETSFLHKNGQTNFAGATGMPRGAGVPYPPYSAPPTSFPHNAVPRAHNAHSASASASASATAPASGPAPAPATAPAPAPAAPEKAKNEVPASKRKENDLKKTDSKKENNGRKKSTSEKSNKRRKKRSEDSDSDEVIRASSISDEDDDDVVEVVEKAEENADNKSRSRKKDSDEEEEEEDEAPENIDVPDADFYKFDDDRTPDSFKEEQIWAVYDDDDGMPRFYARIHKVLKSKEFEVKMNWLEPLTKEKSVVDWLDAGFYQSNGDFKVSRKMSTGNLNIFSHVVAWVKRPKGIVRIEPQKGDVWSLYKEWSNGWNEDTPPDDRHSYEMVEISTDFDDGEGVGVIPLVKVDGFKSVFQKTQLSKVISKDELRRFSHQVPAKKLLGNEQANLPKDCWELDPAASSGPAA